jgi:hypothetical protein
MYCPTFKRAQLCVKGKLQELVITQAARFGYAVNTQLPGKLRASEHKKSQGEGVGSV